MDEDVAPFTVMLLEPIVSVTVELDPESLSPILYQCCSDEEDE